MPPFKSVEEMTEEEILVWKKSLAEEGERPRPFAWGRGPQTRFLASFPWNDAGWMQEAALSAWESDGGVVAGSFSGELGVFRSADLVSESEYEYEPALNRVIECSADGKRYIVGVRNSELQRLRELTDDKPHFLPGLRPLTSR